MIGLAVVPSLSSEPSQQLPSFRERRSTPTSRLIDSLTNLFSFLFDFITPDFAITAVLPFNLEGCKLCGVAGDGRGGGL